MDAREPLEQQIAELHGELERIEVERDLLRQQVAALGRRVDDLERQLAPKDDAAAGEPRPPQVNSHAKVRLAVGEDGFDRTHAVRVRYEWFCAGCKVGGELAFTRCPQCRSEVTRNHHELVPVRLAPFRGDGTHSRLRKTHGYGESIRVTGRGFRDSPWARAGDLLVKITQP